VTGREMGKEGAKYLTTINNNIYYRYKIKNTNLKIIFTYNLELNWQMSCRINWEQNIHDQRGTLKPSIAAFIGLRPRFSHHIYIDI
jgi:hypothetical protein